MKKVIITETQAKRLVDNIVEDLDYHKVDDASPEKDKYVMSQENEEDEVGEGRRSLSRTRKKRLFSKAEVMANPARFKHHDRKLKGVKLKENK
jgi:hypothetical protein